MKKIEINLLKLVKIKQLNYRNLKIIYKIQKKKILILKNTFN